MKMITTYLIALFSISSFAHTVDGVLMLKGSLKTKVEVKGVKTTCKVKVDKVKNLLEEDSHGNPAYEAKVKLELDGNDSDRKIEIKHSREYRMTNYYTYRGTSEVKDLSYFSTTDAATLTIDTDGRIKEAGFTTPHGRITCIF